MSIFGKPVTGGQVIVGYLWVATAIVLMIRVLLVTVGLLLAGLCIQVIWLQFAPMSWWVDYRSVSLIPDRDNGEWVRIERYVDPDETVIPVRRFVELKEFRPGLGLINRCVNTADITAEQDESPYVFWELNTYVGCDVRQLEGRNLLLRVTYQIQLPYGYSKKRSFRLGPMRVQNGQLIAG